MEDGLKNKWRMRLKTARRRRAQLNLKNFPSEKWFLKQLARIGAVNLPRRNLCLLRRYFGDFVWIRERLVLEIDGSSHEGKAEYDARRDAELKANGYRVVRINAYDMDAATRFLSENMKMLKTKPPERIKTVAKSKPTIFDSSQRKIEIKKCKARNASLLADLQKRRANFERDLRIRQGLVKYPASRRHKRAF